MHLLLPQWSMPLSHRSHRHLKRKSSQVFLVGTFHDIHLNLLDLLDGFVLNCHCQLATKVLCKLKHPVIWLCLWPQRPNSLLVSEFSFDVNGRLVLLNFVHAEVWLLCLLPFGSFFADAGLLLPFALGFGFASGLEGPGLLPFFFFSFKARKAACSQSALVILEVGKQPLSFQCFPPHHCPAPSSSSYSSSQLLSHHWLAKPKELV